MVTGSPYAMLFMVVAGCSSKAATDDAGRVAPAPSDAAPPVVVDAIEPAPSDPFLPARLGPTQQRNVLASLRGEWVNHSGLASTRWTFRADGTLHERVTRRGDKADRGRTRSLRATAPRRNRLVVSDGARTTTYNMLVRKKVLYASPLYGIFPMKGARHFLVRDAAGNALEYNRGRCTVAAPGGKPAPARCLYKVSYYHKVLTFRYRHPSTGEPVITIFHGEGGYLLHEAVISCCKFDLRRR